MSANSPTSCSGRQASVTGDGTPPHRAKNARWGPRPCGAKRGVRLRQGYGETSPKLEERRRAPVRGHPLAALDISQLHVTGDHSHQLTTVPRRKALTRVCTDRAAGILRVTPSSRSGETGRRAGLKIPWGSLPVSVRFRPPAPNYLDNLQILAIRSQLNAWHTVRLASGGLAAG